jgi:teichuronic acid biosynthesis glycosyltransferase TuaH
LAEPRRRLDGSRADLIVYLAVAWWNGPAGTDRHLALALREYGPVLYVEPPVSALTRLVKPELAEVASAPRLRVHDPRFAQLVTRVAPGMTRPVLRNLRAPMVGWAVRAAVRKLYGPSRDPVAAVISGRVDEQWPRLAVRRRLLYVTDDLVAGADLLGVSREPLLRAEAVALRGADVVAVVSTDLRDRYAGYGVAAEFVPNGCAPETFDGIESATQPDGVDLPGPVAGFLGHINDRIDLALLEAVADAGCSLLIVGPIAHGYRGMDRFTALTRRPNVRWLGPRPYEDVPGCMRLIDVGLTPYVDSAFNRASFPLKTLEYLAAGRGVVATPLPAHHWLGTDLIEIAAGADEFARRVRDALARPRTADLVERRRTFARRHSWQDRAARIADLLHLDGRRAAAASGRGR